MSYAFSVSQNSFSKNCRSAILKLVSVRRTYQYRREGVPFRQAEYFHHLLKFEEALTSYGLTSFLMDGTLVGAIKYGRFRKDPSQPRDIDFAVMVSEEFSLQLLNEFLLKFNFVLWPGYDKFLFRQRYRYKYSLLNGILKIHSVNISLVIYTRDVNGNWLNPVEEISLKSVNPYGSVKKIDSIFDVFLKSERFAYIFKHKFKVPQNSEELIEIQYGKWRDNY
jgi:hypothetical protein